jgi:uracil permease
MSDQQKMVMDVHERPTLKQWLPLSLQHLFAMFGATILVPLLVGISPAVALVASGVGTLAFLLITRGQVPAYLGSSFAFIAPLAAVVGSEGIGEAMFGALFAGVLYGIMSLLVVKFGLEWIRKVFPPVVIGPVIIVIGLGLASIALNMAVVVEVDNVSYFDPSKFTVAFITLAITIVSAIYLRGFFGLIPILIGIIGGYITAVLMGMISFTAVIDAPWFAVPDFVTPTVSWTAVLIIMPVALVTLVEHMGDMMVISKVLDRNLVERPGLHRTILGDGVATGIAAMIGGPPNTTYGENVGVLALTRVFSVYVVGGAAVLAIIFGFIGKISAFISTIPAAVMGGVTILLFGLIASSGLRVLIDSKTNFMYKRNLIISSVILVSGIGTTILNQQQIVSFSGMALATILGIVLHLLLPEKELSYGEKPMFAEDSNNE